MANPFKMPFPISVEGRDECGGYYPPIRYKCRTRAKICSNKLEQYRSVAHMTDHWNNHDARPLFPRYLCFLNYPESRTMHGVRREAVSTYRQESTDMSSITYAFVSCSSSQFPESSDDALHGLHLSAERATREFGLKAYWIACSCLDHMKHGPDDVYRIDSITRNAARTIIILGRDDLQSEEATYAPTKVDLLKKWGQGMWTRSELLNSPMRQPIEVHMMGEDFEKHWSWSKRELALVAWQDEEADCLIKIIDHHEGHINPDSVELFVLAVKFLLSVQTTEFLPGDLYYVLMGVLPHRPGVDYTDSSFQAFARLSLANNSDLLLERLICMYSTGESAHWAIAGDVWDAKP